MISASEEAREEGVADGLPSYRSQAASGGEKTPLLTHAHHTQNMGVDVNVYVFMGVVRMRQQWCFSPPEAAWEASLHRKYFGGPQGCGVARVLKVGGT